MKYNDVRLLLYMWWTQHTQHVHIQYMEYVHANNPGETRLIEVYINSIKVGMAYALYVRKEFGYRRSLTAYRISIV